MTNTTNRNPSSTPERGSVPGLPHLAGEPVTERHTRYCATYGHATHTVNGVDTQRCPRCGDTKDTSDAEHWRARAEHLAAELARCHVDYADREHDLAREARHVTEQLADAARHADKLTEELVDAELYRDCWRIAYEATEVLDRHAARERDDAQHRLDEFLADETSAQQRCDELAEENRQLRATLDAERDQLAETAAAE